MAARLVLTAVIRNAVEYVQRLKGFFAYPSFPPQVGESITTAVTELRKYHSPFDIKLWVELEIPGRFIAETVLSEIDASDFVVADITTMNFNVVYEIGYALGKKKRVFLVRNEPFAQPSSEVAREVGIFDTLGYKSYENSKELLAFLKEIKDANFARPTVPTPLNRAAPVYLTEDKWRTDGATRIISRIKKARLFFRSFDPTEQPRLSALEAIKQVEQSFGVLVHLVSKQVADHQVSNLRASFIAGLAQGMDKVVAMLQQGADPIPLDYRDLVDSYGRADDIDDLVSDFAGRVYESFQEIAESGQKADKVRLDVLDLGASSAENELRDLHHYYLPTEGYRRALRGEVRLVVGRKGSGKTAVFLQVRDRMRASKSNVVLDLKPDGYRLIKFKDRVLSMLERGSFEHTITAFWECLLCLEICHKVLMSDRDLHRHDPKMILEYRELNSLYLSYGYDAQGDFAERVSKLLNRVEDEYREKYGSDASRMLSTPQITELIHRNDIVKLQAQLARYLRHKDAVWILFDNIDKGWSSRGIQSDDLVIVKSLVEATRKVERLLQRADVDAHSLMFIRNDVFEILIDEMSDRGKEPRAVLDWTDSDMLRELIFRRAKFLGEATADSFGKLWADICVSHVNGEESSQYLIERSLMRPRYLMDLVNHCKGIAVTLGHAKIEAEDIEKGLNIFSSDLIADLSHEIRDVLPDREDAVYAFIGSERELSDDELRLNLMEAGVDDEEIEKLIDVLLWYGFIGLLDGDGDAKFIYNVNYNPRLLRALQKGRSASVKTYAVNPAFWPALGIAAKS